MERMKKLLAALVIAASLLVFSTCDNPVDMLDEVFVEVMQANDRYLEVVSVSPEPSEPDVNPSSTIRIVFDKTLDESTIEGNVEIAYKRVGQELFDIVNISEWTLSYNPDTKALNITPYPYIQPDRTVQVRLKDGLRTVDGNQLLAAEEWSFSTNDDVIFYMAFVDTTGDRIQWANNALHNVKTNIVPIELTITDPVTSAGNYEYLLASTAMTADSAFASYPTGWQTISGIDEEETSITIETEEFPNEGGPFKRYLWVYNPETNALLSNTARVELIYVDRTSPGFDLGSAVVTNSARTFTPAVTETGSGIASYAWSGAGLSISSSNTASVSVAASTQETLTLALTVTDTAGNSGSDTVPFTWDTVAPVAPSKPVLNSGDDTGSSNSDNITNKTTGLRLSGTAEANSTVKIKVAGTAIATVPADGGGAWNATVSRSAGTHSVSATATDAAGNEGPASTALSLVIDTTPPNTPIVSGTTPTTDRTPAWGWTSGGNGGIGSYRYNLDNTAWSATTTATGYTPASDVALGNRTLYVQELDVAGNWSGSGSRLVAVTPLPPTGVAASDSTSTAYVTVSWTAQSAGASGYEVLRATSSGGTYSLIGSSATTSYNDTTASPGTTYWYKVRAIGGGLASTNSGDDSGLRKLSAPTVSASDNTSTSSITVSWGAVTGATSYTLQKSTASGGPYSDLTTITTTSYTDTAVSAGMLYYYRVFAKVGAYPSDYSAYNAGIRKLLAPGSVAATDSTSTSYVTVTWSAVTGATNYYVGRSTSSTGTYTDIGSSATTSYNDTSATPGTVYYYKVHAYSNGYYSDYSAYNAGLRKLAMPSGISATDNTSTSYTTVSWGAVTGATSYYVFRATSSAGTYSSIGSSSTPSFNDTSATPGALYYYKVSAYASGYYSDTSTTYDWGLRKITAPTNVSATDGTLTTGVTITWSAPTGGSSYYVYRYNSSTGIYDYIGNVSSIFTMVSYTDTAVTSTSTQYYYRITPFGSAGTSYPGVQSTYDTGYRGMAAPTGVSATDGTGNGSGGNYVRITWSAVSGATGYSVYYSTAYNGTYILAANTTALYYDYAPPVAWGTVLYYKVRAYTSSSYPGAYSSYNSGYRWNMTSGLTGHWTFDNTWTDYGTANGLYDHFTKATVGSPILSTGRIVGTHSVQVTGDDMKTSLGHTFMSTDRKSMSVAFWVYRRADYASTNYFMMCTDFGIFQSNTSYIGLATWISSGATNSAKYPIPINDWTHIVATYDGTYIRLYVDGILRATTTHAGTISSSYTRYLTLGGFTSPSWNGNIDDLRIYNRVLSTSEITGLYGWR